MNTLRVLGQAQDDITPYEVLMFFTTYMGPPEVTELMLSLHSARYEILEREDDSTSFPPLAAALRTYGAGVKTWENFIRVLLRSCDVDLHAPVPRLYCSKEDVLHYPCALSDLGTPLDELFMWNDSPYDGAEVASDWLQMLADEGYDVLAYLKTEQNLHGAQQGFTYPSSGLVCYETPHKLVFDFRPNPSVNWAWWVDPSLPASIARQEFQDMSFLAQEYYLPSETWEVCWPFMYPHWSIWQAPPDDPEWERRNKRADLRAESRLKKKSNKLARLQGTYKPNRVPGAWPT